MVIHNACNKSSPTVTQVPWVSKRRMRREVVGLSAWAVHQNMQVSFASNNPHCSLPAQAWLTPWPTVMVDVESDPNWGNVKSLRITSVARLSQRIQGDTELPLLGVHCANESACAVHCVWWTAHALCPSILKAEGFFFFKWKTNSFLLFRNCGTFNFRNVHFTQTTQTISPSACPPISSSSPGWHHRIKLCAHSHHHHQHYPCFETMGELCPEVTAEGCCCKARHASPAPSSPYLAAHSSASHLCHSEGRVFNILQYSYKFSRTKQNKTQNQRKKQAKQLASSAKINVFLFI